jgi:pSer/pThr/pTyr-binding forkhead associated (FHA) protein
MSDETVYKRDQKGKEIARKIKPKGMHALIEQEGEAYYFMDKGSTNGSYLNNNPIPRCERVRINSGDILIVGKTKLEIL